VPRRPKIEILDQAIVNANALSPYRQCAMARLEIAG
jgi:hypothetical protein